jgi:hypothetical protein
VGAALHFTRLRIDFFRFPHKSNTRGLAAGIELDPHVLQSAIFLLTIDQPNGERDEPMHPRPASLQ